jgi:hypothetical protein
MGFAMNCRHGWLMTPTFKVLLEGRGFFYAPRPLGEPCSRGFFIVEPKAAEELLKWQERDRLIAGQRDKVRHLY